MNFKITGILLVPLLAWSLTSSVALAKSSDSFEDWLKKYEAWDVLENEYATHTEPLSPVSILQRAKTYLNLKSPEKALDLINTLPTLSDNATEFERLWTGGQANRALGRLPQSVLWYSQAASYVQNKQELIKYFKDAKLATTWGDVWLKLYWAYLSNYTISRSSQEKVLSQIAQIGSDIWGTDFWKLAQSVVSKKIKNSSLLGKTSAKESTVTLTITQEDKLAISQAMALLSLEKVNDSKEKIQTISNSPLRSFWVSFIDYVAQGQVPKGLSTFQDGGFIKASAFWEGNILAPFVHNKNNWFLGNSNSATWTQFRNKVLVMSLEDAQKTIDNELGSMLLSTETRILLRHFKLALLLATGTGPLDPSLLDGVVQNQLPLTLQLADMRLLKKDFTESYPQDSLQNLQTAPLLFALSQAAGELDHSDEEAPFWISSQDEKLEILANKIYPLDRLLTLANWKAQFKKKPTSELAKRGAFLFEKTTFGTQCLLYLTHQSLQAKDLQLAAFYLNKINHTELPTSQRIDWLNAKATLEFDSGRNEAALETFNQMDKLNAPLPAMIRLRVALLYQQQRDFSSAKKQLLVIQTENKDLSTELKAEILFWLGEGEQAVKHTESALKYYLTLAWKYPQENIWALTAMYRASLIYEKRGNYPTAKRLLTTVVKNAGRKSQREAAKARIDAINNKMGPPNKTQDFQFPF
ncbi:tetratricopeptide repeat protein [Pseudodesulfovibrio piezophilus]|uniref:Tetratricopeptide repeat protein n=1 Tax=Pseudodesulfovibrio piezophilus (strain DSM 21447 / JCM 15486 / C1TLV30) TaxID=1322246 RepID=M1WNN5_PSEP2|nr:tetratricopeptide repeat protein [Pseudodesulfovibrio piezophilus]CCH47689.1 conserved exported protein of unknown function [Pseudodesulfovibrio piezophilus C1TLV30]